MAKNVEIIIKADDQASAKFKQVGKSMESTSKQFKETGNKAKASTELVGTFATVLGGSGVGAFAGEMAQLTERFNAFSEVAEKSRLATVAFRGALVAGVGIAAVKIGQAIGDIVFQTDRLNAELERTKELTQAIGARLVSSQSRQIGEQISDVQQLVDLEERRAQAQQLQSRIGGDLATKSGEIARLTAEIESREAGVFGWVRAWSGEFKQTTEQKRQQVELAEKLRDNLRDQNQQLIEIATGERDRIEAQREAELAQQRQQQASAAFVQSLGEEVELLKAKAEGQDAVNKLEAARQTGSVDDGRQALQLMRERDALLSKAEAEKVAQQAAQRAADDERRRSEQIASTREKAIDAIRQQVIALRDGEAAARAFALQQQGLDAGSAQMIAQAEERLQQIRDAMQSTSGPAEFTATAAVESRLKSAAGRSNPMLLATKETANETKLSRRVLTQIRDVMAAIERKNPVEVAVNSA